MEVSHDKFTEQQIKWAKEHDWFMWVGWDGSILCSERNADSVGNVTTKFVEFVDFKSLYQWAGY